VTVKQVDLTGRMIEHEKMSDSEEQGLLKSALQKSIRHGNVGKAMYFALKLAEKNWWSCWRRLSVIADEDCGQSLEIVAVDCLYRKFLGAKKQGKDGELGWDAKRCVVCAAKILAEAWKDRRSDEFLEVVDAIEKHGDTVPELEKVLEQFSAVPDEAYDMHTVQGRKMGRGNLYWYEVSSQTELRTVDYELWREWFEPLMVKITKLEGEGKKEKKVIEK
jgi:replication-associated recombination protein RarA